MRVLVCGGRDYSASDAFNWLNANAEAEIAHDTRCYSSLSIEAVIHGSARGADEGAAMWGVSEHAKVLAYPADWKNYGKSAGPRRNQRMIDEGKPDIVIAFPGGRGTADMASRAKAVGITVIEIQDAPPRPGAEGVPPEPTEGSAS